MDIAQVIPRVYKPGLPPYALLHYRDFDQVCAYLGGVCEYVEKALGEDARKIAEEEPQILPVALRSASFKGPYARLWRRLQLDLLPASFERWPSGGSRQCPKLVWRASPSVFLMSPERMYQYVVRSTTLMRLLRELGIRLWEYDHRKRVVLRVVRKPRHIMWLAVAGLPPAEELGACGYHAAASMKYWAEAGAIMSISKIIESGRIGINSILPDTTDMEQ